jgi:hypothetical protein
MSIRRWTGFGRKAGLVAIGLATVWGVPGRSEVFAAERGVAVAEGSGAAAADGVTLPPLSPGLAALEAFDFAKTLLPPERLDPLSLDDLKRLRGIVFGRHGRVFKERDIQAFLLSRPWYSAADGFQNSALTDLENRNLDLIREAEARKHPHIEPGDLRFHMTRAFTEAELGPHTAVDLRVMKAEIEAIHGKRFNDDPWLQKYFEERYWYHAAEKYEPGSLTSIERQNIATIIAAEKRGRHLKIALGDMEAFQSQPLTEAMLVGLSLNELRLLRNEVYARRGKVFKTWWIQDYFYGQDWYTPDEQGREPKLSPVEQRNVAVIVKYEQKLHERLGLEPISDALLEGMYLEDARKLRQEILARHGKVFKDRGTQKYFSSFAWYRADPSFNEKKLSPVEKKNIATILAYERIADSVMQMVEG